MVSAWRGGEREHQHVVPREVLVEALARRRRSASGARAPAPRRRGRAPRRRQRGSSTTSSATSAEHDADRHRPDGEAEAAAPAASARIAGPYWAFKRSRICCLVSPWAISRGSRARSWSARGGLGDVQRHVARVAHDLVLDVVERRPRLRRRAPPPGAEREQRYSASSARRASRRRLRRARWRARRNSCVTSPREIATTWPRRSSTNVSGSSVGAVLAGRARAGRRAGSDR